MKAVADSLCGSIELRNVSKRFGNVTALSGVTFSIRAGEIHAVVGENGAGKSTLISILDGAIEPTSGTAHVSGRVPRREAGSERQVSTVFQDLRLAPDLTVAENLFLGFAPSRHGFIDRELMRQRALAVLARLGASIDPASRVADLDAGQQQIVEIGRALAVSSPILILDEPTSRLGHEDTERLLAILREINEKGTTIVFVSHRLKEVRELCDRISVLRDGHYVTTRETNDCSESQLVDLMVGKDAERARGRPKQRAVGRELLRVKELCTESGDVLDASFVVRAGEVVGIVGVDGNGQRPLLRALAGLERRSSGSMQMAGKAFWPRNARSAQKHGVIYVSGDREREGVFGALSVRENLTASPRSEMTIAGVVRVTAERRRLEEAGETFSIKVASAEQPITSLSGGNQQKVVLARALDRTPRILVLDDPTQGIDVGTRADVYELMDEWVGRGLGVVMRTSDTSEALALCDRAFVMVEGRIVRELTGDEIDERSIVDTAATHRTDIGSDSGTANGGDARQSSSERPSIRRFGEGVRSSLGLIPLALIVGALIAIGAVTSPVFLEEYNLDVLATTLAPLLFVAVGQAVVMGVGGIDLSVGPAMSLTTVAATFLVAGSGTQPFLGALIILAAGLMVGLANGLLIEYLKIPDLLATLGTFSVLSGLALAWRASPGGVVSFEFVDAVGVTGGLQAGFLVALAIAIAVGVVVARTNVGRVLLATGSNRRSAEAVGARVSLLRILAYGGSGLLAAAAGLILAATLGSGDPTSGTNYTLMSVAAAVVGGVSIFGGRLNVVGVGLGATLLVTLTNILSLNEISSYWQMVATAVITIVAVAGYSSSFRRLFKFRALVPRATYERSTA